MIIMVGGIRFVGIAPLLPLYPQKGLCFFCSETSHYRLHLMTEETSAGSAVTATKTKHLIVSRFNEDLSWLNVLPVHEFDHVYIYNKGKDDLEVKRRDIRYTIIKLPNVGKCDHSYIYHILTKYECLGDVNVFLPGTADDSIKLFNTLVTTTVALHTGRSMFVGHAHPQGVRQKFFNFTMEDYETRDERNRALEPSREMKACDVRPFGFWYLVNFPDIEVFHVSYFGIFAVTKEHIRNRSFDGYVSLYKYLNTHRSPEAGHYFERSWLAIFHPIPVDHIYPIPDNKFVGLSKTLMERETTYELKDLCGILGLTSDHKSSLTNLDKVKGTDVESTAEGYE